MFENNKLVLCYISLAILLVLVICHLHTLLVLHCYCSEAGLECRCIWRGTWRVTGKYFENLFD